MVKKQIANLAIPGLVGFKTKRTKRKKKKSTIVLEGLDPLIGSECVVSSVCRAWLRLL